MRVYLLYFQTSSLNQVVLSEENLQRVTMQLYSLIFLPEVLELRAFHIKNI